MNTFQRLIDAMRHRGEHPASRTARRARMALEAEPPKYRSTVYPETTSAQLSDAERRHRLTLVERGRTVGKPTRSTEPIE